MAIPTCESLTQLQPGKCYQIYVRAVNIGGPSEKSESFTVTTTGEIPYLCLSMIRDYGETHLIVPVTKGNKYSGILIQSNVSSGTSLTA